MRNKNHLDAGANRPSGLAQGPLGASVGESDGLSDGLSLGESDGLSDGLSLDGLSLDGSLEVSPALGLSLDGTSLDETSLGGGLSVALSDGLSLGLALGADCVASAVLLAVTRDDPEPGETGRLKTGVFDRRKPGITYWPGTMYNPGIR